MAAHVSMNESSEFTIDGVRCLTLPEQKVFDDIAFPLVLTPTPDCQSLPTDEWLQWTSHKSADLKKLLQYHGAILFRGFPFMSPGDFDGFSKGFGYDSFPYVGGAAARQWIVGNVFTANEAPSDSTIPYHHEMAQVPNSPQILFFYCDVVPGAGGETPIVPSHVAYKLIAERAPEFIDRLSAEGVKYVRVAPDRDDVTSAIGRSWRSTFQTEERSVAESRAAEQGTEFEWLEDGSMKTVSKILPATKFNEQTGRTTWFNSIIAAYTGWQDVRNEAKKAVVFGSGVTMPEDSMKIVLGTMDELAVAIPWQRGDVLMVDNRQALHARRPFSPPRRILAALYKD